MRYMPMKCDMHAHAYVIYAYEMARLRDIRP
jgi:hypothetical protein